MRVAGFHSPRVNNSDDVGSDCTPLLSIITVNVYVTPGVSPSTSFEPVSPDVTEPHDGEQVIEASSYLVSALTSQLTRT